MFDWHDRLYIPRQSRYLATEDELTRSRMDVGYALIIGTHGMTQLLVAAKNSNVSFRPVPRACCTFPVLLGGWNHAKDICGI